MGTDDPERNREDGSEAIAEETVFDLLSSPRRRYTLYYLRRTTDVADVQAIATQVAAWENGVPVDAVDRQQRKRVYVSLYQTHLPRLASVEAIEYDDENGTVGPGADVERIDSYLAGGASRDSWGQYYLAISVVGALAIGSAGTGVLSLPLLVVSVVAVVAVALLAGVQTVRDNRQPPTIPPDVTVPDGEHDQ